MTPPFERFARTLFATALPALLAACAVQRPPAQVEAPVPTQWQAPLPHHGSTVDMARWWEQLQDPLLVELIEAAQRVSPTLSQARSQLVQARSTQVSARSALLPALDGQGAVSRGFSESVGDLASTAQGAVQASWEIDLFGANAATRDAAQARLAGAQAQWHEARVSVTAEVVQQYTSLRSCTRQLTVSEADARSRGETSRLSSASEKAGFTAPATAALAAASFSEAKVRASQQRMQCEIDLKTLVALTGQDEAALRSRLAASTPSRPPEQLFTLTSLPAQVLSQRPDVYNAEREVAAVSAEVGNAQAQRYPRLSLSGSIGRLWIDTAGTSVASNTWSIGPLSLSVPIFDAGKRAAQVEATQARYDDAVQQYRGKVRQAVSEVEQALVKLASTAERSADAQRAAEGYRQSLEATEARWRGGLASQVELEDARRAAFASDTALVTLEQERMAAWVALYRAAGGGWDAGQNPAAAPAASTTAQAAAH